MRILNRTEFSAQEALKRAIDSKMEYRGYKLLSHYYMRHNYCEVITPDNKALPELLYDVDETDNEFQTAVRNYIDGLTNKVKE
jgi:hypothetical protein